MSRTCMSHVTYEYPTRNGVMSHIHEPCHMTMRHVTCVTLHINELCHTPTNHITCQWVMPHMDIRRGTECFTALMWTCRAVLWMYINKSHIDESCDTSMSYVTCQRTMSHINKSWNIPTSRHTSTNHVAYRWVMSHVTEACHMSMSHVPTKHLNSKRCALKDSHYTHTHTHTRTQIYVYTWASPTLDKTQKRALYIHKKALHIYIRAQ